MAVLDGGLKVGDGSDKDGLGVRHAPNLESIGSSGTRVTNGREVAGREDEGDESQRDAICTLTSFPPSLLMLLGAPFVQFRDHFSTCKRCLHFSRK